MKTTDEEIEDALDRLCKYFGWDTPSEQRGEIRTNMRDLVRWAREERDKEWVEIIQWLSGEKGDFPTCPDNARYCWRTPLREKVKALLSPKKEEDESIYCGCGAELSPHEIEYDWVCQECR